MLDPRYLRRNIKEVAERLAIKGFELDQKFIEDKEIQRKNSSRNGETSGREESELEKDWKT